MYRILIAIALLTGCSKTCELSADLSIPDIKVERLEDKLFAMQSPGEVLDFLQANSELKIYFLGSEQYPNDTVLAEILFSRITNPHIDTLRREAKEAFGDMSDLSDELGRAMAHLQSYYPAAKIPKVQTMVTGFGTSEMYVSDSLVIIGLDYYIGPEATYRPNEYPNYILERYQKPYIVPAIALLLAENYAVTDYQDNTMLADMIYYGKKYHFTKQLMPCTADSLIIWYTDKQLVDINENQHIIWGTFLQNELLFETNHMTKEKFLGERPNTYEISAVCPGRIGAWVGWEIVRKYAEDHPDVSLEDLMAESSARKIFTESNYKGKAPGFF